MLAMKRYFDFFAIVSLLSTLLIQDSFDGVSYQVPGENHLETVVTKRTGVAQC